VTESRKNTTPPSTPLELAITGLDESGAGLAEHEHLLVHVARALPHERVSANLVHTSPHQRPDGRRDAWADLEDVVVASADRVAPVCAGYGRCGGCVLQHLSIEGQRTWKRGRVETALTTVLAAATGAATPPTVAACVPSPKSVGYRNQAKYVVGRDERGRLILGAYAPRSHHVVDLAGCLLGESPQDAIAVWLRNWLEARAIPPFDERTRTGIIRYVVIRTNEPGEALVTLVTAKIDFPDVGELAQALRDAFPVVVGVVQNVNSTTGNVIFGAEERVIAGAGTITESFGGTSIDIGPRAFLQINRGVAITAYEAIRAALVSASGGQRFGRIVDVHSGVGAIAFSLADLAEEVVAIEVNVAATAAGAAAASRAQKHRVRFVNQDAAMALDEIGAADALVLNPPRAGAGPLVCARIKTLRPRVVAYLSCDPETLARDLADLLDPRGFFTISSIQPFDMLPHTTHVETLVVLRGNI
jgi:23S rRNA (uracil1939-C5)-methyltransferase